MAEPILILAVTFLLLGLMLGPLLVLAFLKLKRLGKAFIIMVDPDARSVTHFYTTVKDGSFTRGDKLYLVDGASKHGGKYSTWIVNATSGHNYRLPTRIETAETDPVSAVLLAASNPESYFYAQKRNGWRNVLRAGEDTDKWKWVFPVALIGLIAILCTLMAVVWLISKVGKTAAGGVPGVG